MEDKEPKGSEQEILENAANQTETVDSGAENAAENDKLAAMQQQLDDSRTKYLYLASDFDNYKRHAAKERLEQMQMANRDIVSALLPILDDFDRAVKNGEMNDGINLIHQKLQYTLENKGLKQLIAKAGDTFNADVHEAVAEIPAASEALKGKIVDVLEQGYTLGDRIIRFAKVVVGK